MPYKVDINQYLQDRNIFHNAHDALIFTYPNHNLEDIRQLWKNIYGVKIIYKTITSQACDPYQIWTAMEFESKEHYVLFVLEWS